MARKFQLRLKNVPLSMIDGSYTFYLRKKFLFSRSQTASPSTMDVLCREQDDKPQKT